MSDLDYSLVAIEQQAPRSNVPQSVRALRRDGGTGLGDLELLAMVIGPGRGRDPHEAAREILSTHGWPSLVDTRPEGSWWDELRPAQAVRLAAALELARRLSNDRGRLGTTLRTPRDVYDATADLRQLRREYFVGLYLNTRHRLLARETISVGSLNASIVHPREVYEPALRQGAASLIVVHNHPSGETDPSEDDIAITRRLDEAGNVLGITLLDHVIVGTGGFTSMKEEQHL